MSHVVSSYGEKSHELFMIMNLFLLLIIHLLMSRKLVRSVFIHVCVLQSSSLADERRRTAKACEEISWLKEKLAKLHASQAQEV
jgi:hypothetical protein